VSADPAGDPPRQHALPITGGPVPVFDCRAFVTRPDGRGVVRARCGNLAGVTAEGPSEREALLRLVARFKDVVRQHAAAGEPVPWIDPCPEPDADERPRWIPVHL
jgi:hypothetical protein